MPVMINDASSEIYIKSPTTTLSYLILVIPSAAHIHIPSILSSFNPELIPPS